MLISDFRLKDWEAYLLMTLTKFFHADANIPLFFQYRDILFLVHYVFEFNFGLGLSFAADLKKKKNWSQSSAECAIRLPMQRIM